MQISPFIQNPTKLPKKSTMHHHNHHPHPLISLSFFLTLSISSLFHASAAPLYTQSRWIVDGAGRRVKLACVNWPAHMEAGVVEGLSHQPLDTISKKVAALGFNCIRLTWPTYLATNHTLAALTTVRASFEMNGLGMFVPGLVANNPSIVDLPLIKAFQAVVRNLADNRLMIILDNHVTRPGWCCASDDGNGFVGDEYFNPDLWLQGLTAMATMFNSAHNVVAMSLRNELRGPRQNTDDWFRYMQRGAEAVHEANPNVLVILSGFNYALDLSFLKTRTVSISFTQSRKLVFEVHRYSFSGGRGAWKNGNANDACKSVVDHMTGRAFFLQAQWPVILTEFGADLTGGNENDNRFFSCLLGLAAELDLDWAYWELGGSYYRRFSVVGLNDTYGLLNWDWSSTKNTSFMEGLSAIQPPFQGPGVGSFTTMHQIIFHPLSGKCIVRKSDKYSYQLMLGPCSESSAWEYSPNNGTLAMNNGTAYLYLQAQGQGEAVQLVVGTKLPGSTWKQISSSNMHLSSQLNVGKSNGTSLVCLDLGADGAVITEACKCLSKDNVCNPANQWFKIINTSRKTAKLTVKISN